MKIYTDNQLKEALVRILPDILSNVKILNWALTSFVEMASVS